MNSTVSVTFDSNNPMAINAIKFMRSLDFLKVSKAVEAKPSKEAVLDEIKQARKEAEKIKEEKTKGHSIAEILATI